MSVVVGWSTSAIADDNLIGFWDFKGTDGEAVSTVVNSDGATEWVGTTAKADAANDKGMLPIWSSDAPGVAIYDSAINCVRLCNNPGSLHFRRNTNDGFGGQVDIAGLSSALSKLDAFTVEYFVRYDDGGGAQPWSGSLCFSSANGGFRVTIPDGSANGSSLRFYSLDSSFKNTNDSVGLTNLKLLNQWHHIAVVYENGTMRCYYDYELKGTVAYDNSELSESKPLRLGNTLGSKATTANYNFRGKISCLRVVSRALNADGFMLAANDPDAAETTVFSWNFEEGADKVGEGFKSLSGWSPFLLDGISNGDCPYYAAASESEVTPTWSSDVLRRRTQCWWGNRRMGVNTMCAEFHGWQNVSPSYISRMYAGMVLRRAGIGVRGDFANPASWTMEAYVKPRSFDDPTPSWIYPVLLFGKAGISKTFPKYGSAEYNWTPKYCWQLTMLHDGSLRLHWTEDDGTLIADADEGPGVIRQINCGGKLTDDKWHHVALTYDDTIKTFKVYLDFTLLETATITDGNTLWDGPYEYEVARGTGANGFEGWMDEVRFSRKVLEPSEFVRLRAPDGALLIIR